MLTWLLRSGQKVALVCTDLSREGRPTMQGVWSLTDSDRASGEGALAHLQRKGTSLRYPNDLDLSDAPMLEAHQADWVRYRGRSQRRKSAWQVSRFTTKTLTPSVPKASGDKSTDGGHQASRI